MAPTVHYLDRAVKSFFALAAIFSLLFSGLLSPISKPVYADTISCIMPPSGLVSWWAFDGNANDLKDGNTGVLQNQASFGSAKVGQGILLDGVDDYVSMGSPANLRGLGHFSIDAWIKTNDMVEGQRQAIVTKWGQDPLIDSYGIWLVKTGGVIKLNGAIGVSGSSTSGITGGSIQPNTFVHVAMTYDTATSFQAIYVDGEQVATATRGSGPTQSNVNFLIGREDSTKPRPFAGTIDEVQVFNRVLSSSEIRTIFLAGEGGQCRNFSGATYVLGDGASCEALPVIGSSATWEPATSTCTIPTDSSLSLEFIIAPGTNVNNLGSVGSGTPQREFGQIINEGTINNFGTWGGTIINEATGLVENSGLLNIGGFSTLFNKGTVVNVEDGFLKVGGGIHNDVNGHLTNYGVMEHTNNDGDDLNEGLIDNFGSIANNNDNTFVNDITGTINNHDGAVIISEGDTFHNHGTINNLAGGVFDDFFGFTNFDSGVINNDGALNVYCDTPLNNHGTIRGNPANNLCILNPDQPPGISNPSSVTLTTTTQMTDICGGLPLVDAVASGSDANVPANAIDNILQSRWSALGKGSWITIELNAPIVVCGLDIAWYQGNTRTNDFVVSVSRDGTFFRDIFSGKSSGTTLSQEHYDFSDSVANYVKVTVNGNSVNNWASITEIDATGYTSLGVVNGRDDEDFWALVQNNAPSNAFPLGTTTVTWTGSDTNGSVVTRTQQVTFSGPADTTRPNVAITSPANGATLTGPSPSFAVNIAGTASDSGSGVQKVELRTTKNGVVIHPYSLVIPASPGNWATWSKSLTFSEDGTYSVVARATDNAGNLQWHVISIQITLSSAFPIVHMSDTTASSGLSVHANRPAQVEFATASSQLVGDKIDQITIKLRKVGSPTGTLQVGIFNADLTVKKSFGTKNVGTLTGSYADYTFSLTNNELYTIASGDRIGIKFTGVESTTNYVAVMRDTSSADPFDGSNTYYQYYSTAWNSVPSFDMYMILKQTHS